METQIKYLHNLLNSHDSYKDVIEAMDNLQTFDKLLLENFSPELVNLYCRLDSINDISNIYALIPIGHKIIDKLPEANRKAILNIVNSYPPNINICPQIQKPDLNVLDSVVKLRKEFNIEYKRRKCTLEFEISDGFPIIHNHRRLLLANFFNIEYGRVYVSRKLNILQEIFANTMLSHFDIYAGEMGVNKPIKAFLRLVNDSKEPLELIQSIKDLKNYLREHNILYNNIYTFLNLIKDGLQSPSINEYLLTHGYEGLRSLVDGSCCVQNMLSTNCRDRKIAYDYIKAELLPLLSKSQTFQIPSAQSATVHLFLDAFPYHNYHYCYVKCNDKGEFVLFEEKKIEHLKMSSKTIEKFTGLLHLTNLNLPYKIIFDLTKSVNFSVTECISMFHYVLDFKNYICAFLASLVCQHNVNIFDIVNTKLQYQLVKCLPMDYHLQMQTDICRYTPVNSKNISLHLLYKTFDVNLDLVNYNKFVQTIEHIKLIARNKAQLYMICSQLSYNEFYVYRYLKSNPKIDSITNLILSRILLGNPQLSDAEKNILHYNSRIASFIPMASEQKIGFPPTNLATRTFTIYDRMSLSDYFSDGNNFEDIPLIVEEVPIAEVEEYLVAGDSRRY